MKYYDHASRITLYYLAIFVFFIPIAQSSLNLTVTNFDGAPVKEARIQIFPGEIYPDSDIKPIAPQTPREDGLIGFVTNANGKVRIDLPAGDYTVVAFNRHHPHNFLIIKQVNAPGNVNLSAKNDASPIEIKAIGVNGQPMGIASVFMRPCRNARCWIGLLDATDGVLNARVTQGTYHIVLSGSIVRSYLVKSDQQIAEGDKILIDARELPTAQLKIDLPKKTALAIYEVLETDLTYEYVQAVEKVIGYDAAYTGIYSLALGSGTVPTTLSAGLDYNFNISYLVDIDGAFYAYEIRPAIFYASSGGIYVIGNTGSESFRLEIETDENSYLPGDIVTVNFVIKDTRGNKLHRFFDYSSARLIFPYCVVKNPDGTVIAENSNAEMQEDFFSFSFSLLDSTRTGEYTVQTHLDAKMYGILEDSKQFTVEALDDRISPTISKLDFPSIAEAGKAISFTAEISDNVGVDNVVFEANVADQDYQLPFLRENGLYTFTFVGELAVPGQFKWTLKATDLSNNTARREGVVSIQDSLAPEIIHQPVRTAEIGQECVIEAKIIDNVAVESAKIIYDGQQYELETRNTSSLYIAKIPADHLALGKFNYIISAQDTSGNIARSSQRTIEVVDTTPPSIFHTPIEPSDTLGLQLATVTALITDNNVVEKVTLFYHSPEETTFTTIDMTASGNSYTATIPGTSISALGLEYRIEATDARDLDGKTRKSSAPSNADAFSIAVSVAQDAILCHIVPTYTQDEPLELIVGSSKQFELVALDQSGERVPVNPIWTVTNGLGQIEQGMFVGASSVATGRVIATIPSLRNGRPLSAETYVKLNPAPAKEIVLNYQSIVLSAGDECQIDAVVYDAYGNLCDDRVSYKVVGDSLGSIDDTGKFIARKIGNGTIQASVSSAMNQSLQVEVTFGDLSELLILPNFAELKAGEKLEFTVKGVDGYGNTKRVYPIFSVSGGIGKIDSDGNFVATRSGEGEVIATLAGLQRRAPVMVTAGELKKISVDPFIEYVPISIDEKIYKRQFIAFGWDAGENPVPIENLSWQVDTAAGMIDKNGLFVSTDKPGTPVGNIVINGSLFAKSGELSRKSIVVIYHKPPEVPSSLAISIENNPPGLASITLAAGEEYKLEATGITPQNHRIAVSPHYDMIGNVGVIRPDGVLEATRVGDGTLIATYGAMTAKLDVEVTPGILHEIVLEPEFLNLEVGESCQLSAFGYDAYGNSVVLNQVSYDSAGVVDFDEIGEIIALKPGVGHVVASIGKIRGHAHIFVSPPTLNTQHATHNTQHATRFIYPNPLSIPVGKTQKFVAYGNDVLDVTWQVTDGLGTIDQDGVFRAENVGDGYVLMTDATGYTASAYLQVVELDLDEKEIDRIFIVPNREISLQVGQWQKFYTLGLEKSGKVRPVLASWSLTQQIGHIDALGILRAYEKGECMLRATYGSRSDVCYVKIAEKSEGENTPNKLCNSPPKIWCESRRLAKIKIIHGQGQADATELKSGDSLRFDAIGIDVDSTTVAVIPAWSINGDVKIGTIGGNGLFVADQVGTGEIVATVDGISDSVPIEVIANRPAFARLEPDLFVASDQPNQHLTSVKCEFIAYDCRGNIAGINSDIRWFVVGDVGSIEQTGRFVPNPNAKDDEGEIIAIADEFNLLGRCKVIFRHDAKIDRIEVNPSQIEIIRGDRFKFDLAVVGALVSPSEQFGASVEWKVFRGEQPLDNMINSEGEIFVDRSLRIGEELRVVANLVMPDGKTYTAEATVSVITGSLNRIKLTNLTGTNRISIGEKIEFKAFGYDLYNNFVETNPTWHVNPEMIGSISLKSGVGAGGMDCTFSAERQGFGTISVSQNGITQTADIVVISPQIGGLTIIPAMTEPLHSIGQTPDNRFEIPAGTQLPLLTENDAGAVCALSWKVEPVQAGRLNYPAPDFSQGCMFYPKRPGDAKIIAEVIGAQADFFVKIVPGDVAFVKISPAIASVLTNETQQFSVSFFDVCGNEIQAESLNYEWMTTGGIGTIDSSGLFKPIHVMVGEVVHGTVDVIADGVHGNASVTVLAKLGELHSINLTAEPQTVPANSESTITIYGADADGNPITSIKQQIDFETPEFGEIRATSQNERWIYNAPENLPEPAPDFSQGRRQIILSASVASIHGTTTLQLIPAPLNELKIELKTVGDKLQAGNDYNFALTGFDAFGNMVVLKNVDWTLNEPIGELIDENVDGVTYRAERSGDVALIAESDGIQVLADLKILPRPPISLKISPEKTSLIAGSVQEIRIFGLDEYGNENETISNELVWEIEGIAGQLEKIPSELGKFVFSSSSAGKGSIRIFYETPSGKMLTTSAEIEVVSGKLERLELSLLDGEIWRSPPFELFSGRNYSIRATGFDQYGNTVEVDLNWSLSGDIGKFSTIENEASIEAFYVGEGKITVSSGSCSKSEKIEVVPFTMTIGTNGGLVNTPAKVSIDIPKDALDRKMEISVAIIHPPGASYDAERVSRVYELQPRGLILRKPAKLTIPASDYNLDTHLTQKAKPKLYFWDEFAEKWIASGGTDIQPLTSVRGDVSTFINHFAPYTVMMADESAKAEKFSITDVQLTPPVFYAPENNRLTIEYRITNDAQITIKIFDFRDRLVTTLLDSVEQKAGRNAVQWDGIDSRNELVKNGRYVVVIIAESGEESAFFSKLLVVFK